jgi:phenylacetate-CoA ligase
MGASDLPASRSMSVSLATRNEESTVSRPDLDYFDPSLETLPRDALRRLQEQRLLAMLPTIYERSALIRATWDAAGVTPSDIRSLDDYLAKAPFIDKDMIRAHRDAHDDPCGGVQIADVADLGTIGTTSGTTGDPTPCPGNRGIAIEAEMMREFWHIGARPGDALVYMLFTFRGGFLSSGFYGDAGFTPIAMPHDPAALPLMIEAIETYRPTVFYMLSTPMMIGLEKYFEQSGKDPRQVFASIRGGVFGGEPMAPRFQALAKEWGLEIFDYTTLGDVTGAMECRMHNGFHAWEDLALVENLDPSGNPVPDGAPGELVVTSLADPYAPMVRFRTGDLVRMDRAPCGCGRTHVRFWTLGRMGDQTTVQGKAILPRDIQRLVEQHRETKTGLFQIIRPQAEMETLRLRVGYEPDLLSDAPAALAARLSKTVSDDLGVPVEIDLVLAAELLKLGPPQKIPRVTKQ